MFQLSFLLRPIETQDKLPINSNRLVHLQLKTSLFQWAWSSYSWTKHRRHSSFYNLPSYTYIHKYIHTCRHACIHIYISLCMAIICLCVRNSHFGCMLFGFGDSSVPIHPSGYISSPTKSSDSPWKFSITSGLAGLWHSYNQSTFWCRLHLKMIRWFLFNAKDKGAEGEYNGSSFSW